MSATLSTDDSFQNLLQDKTLRWVCTYPVSGSLECLFVTKTPISYSLYSLWNEKTHPILRDQTYREAVNHAHEVVKKRAWLSHNDSIRVLLQADRLSTLLEMYFDLNRYMDEAFPKEQVKQLIDTYVKCKKFLDLK